MKEILAVVGISIVVIVFIFVGIIWGVNNTAFPSQLAKIEQLRQDSADVDPAQAEDVIGQVTSWNQFIKAQQTNNKLWWAGWSIPDGWDSVQLIEVPQ